MAEPIDLPAVQSIQGAEVVVVADSDAHRLRAVADLSVEQHYADHRTLLAQAEHKLWRFSPQMGSHVQIALDALQAGKDVLIERPLDLDLDRCGDLITSASGSRIKIMMGLNRRWHRLVGRVRQNLQ